METKEITFNIDAKTLTKLEEALKITKISKDEFINQSIDERVQDIMEDMEDIIDSDRICYAIDEGKMKVYSLEEVETELGL